MRTVLYCAATLAALEALKLLFGTPVALTVSVAALAFCIGALWGAGAMKQRLETPPEQPNG